MFPPIRRAAIFALALLGFMFSMPFAASAHEHREVGDYTLVVGFINEPAVQGDTNGMLLTVTQGDEPVTGLADSMKAQAIFGEQTRDFDLVPAWGQNGTYHAVFIPTEPGDYTFRFYGQINGTDVDEYFTSSPEGFDSVAPRADLEFPSSSSASTATLAAPAALGAIVLLGGAVAWIGRQRRDA